MIDKPINNVFLDRHELEALFHWHTEQECEYARKGDYLDADFHKKRAEELRRLIK